MLVALDTSNLRPVSLPDFEAPAELALIRERARTGDLLCPECKALLWLRAGEQRVPYFAHRQLDDCPQSRVSAAILNARHLLYHFFQERVQRREIVGPVELEPPFPGLPEKARLDLIVRRGEKRPLAVMLVEGRVSPSARERLPEIVTSEGFIFRPVFLISRIKQSERNGEAIYLLDTTQREWAYPSPYGTQETVWSAPKTLHYIAEKTGEWRTLRGAHVWHWPQGYKAQSAPMSPIDRLRWSDKHSDWTHSGEIVVSPPSPQAAAALPVWRSNSGSLPAIDAKHTSPEHAPRSSKRFNCKGCGQRVEHWMEAKAHIQVCVCHSCYSRGTRLR